uniref:Uncharacterized protein n=1 Tax=Ralstonia syzygii R24 TaxID=907261 RepID=G3AAN4_9RALS|nr:hypothetical protein RALSY_mp30775 [Ralstonia syzygii R24]
MNWGKSSRFVIFIQCEKHSLSTL